MLGIKKTNHPAKQSIETWVGDKERDTPVKGKLYLFVRTIKSTGIAVFQATYTHNDLYQFLTST